MTVFDIDTRSAVWDMTNGDCACCGVRLHPYAGRPSSFHIDHVVPRSLGGGDDIDNLQPLCRDCNLSKGNRGTVDHLPHLRPKKGPEGYSDEFYARAI